MAINAKKTASGANMQHWANPSEELYLHRRAGGRTTLLQEISSSKMPPTGGAEIHDLMAELDGVKKALLTAQRRVSELETKVNEDALLPVLNRRGFERELERTFAYIERHQTDVSLVFIDLDDFKSINDIHGHAAGDAALMHVVDTLLASIRRSDVVARLGGDEFAILLHRADEEAAMSKSDQLARALAVSSLEYEGKKIAMSLTAGVTQLRGTDTTASAMARADRSMYTRKARRERA